MSPLKKSSFEVLAVIVMLGSIIGLNGCGNDGKFNGKTAQEWAAEAERNKAVNPNVQGKSNQQVQGEKANEKATQEQQKTKEAEAERMQKQQAADETFRAKASEQAKTIASSKDGKIVAEAVEVGLTQVGTSENYLNRMAGSFLMGTMTRVTPEFLVEGIHKPDYKVVREERGKIRQAVIKSFTDDLKRLDLVWTVIRPVLRQKYALLNTLRGHEKLFKTAYTQKAYAPLYECMQWHETLIYPRGDKPATTPNKKDTEGCNKTFKSFGVDGVQFGIENKEGVSEDHANIAFDNAMWIVEFLKRREADGGEKFAQAFQRIALDYIK